MACGEIGLSVQYFYKLTQRQFYNIVNGYRRKEDYLSRERWIIARRMTYLSLGPYMPRDLDVKETDIITFSWEKDLVEKLTDEEKLKAIEADKASSDFWDSWDKRKVGKA